ncbi:MAG: beta-ketoacyl-ACP synthase III [Anaerolineales bacterium]|jgi:3-oxoacyl-[acyl-carrier-protein] synthase-3
MTRYAHIVGWGMSVPRRVLTNGDLAQMVDTSEDWILSRTGIRERHIAEPDQTTASLATDAARQALLLAGLTPLQIDLIIVATSSPEHIFPATACLVQDRLGATHAGAFDLSAACTGFIYALAVATQMIATGGYERALVIGAETLSRIVNWQDRATCVLFGDGAGAFVLQASAQEGGLLAHTMHSDGSGGDLLSLPAGGSRFPTSKETVEKGLHYVSMNGPEVYRFATRVMVSATREVTRKAGIRLRDIDRIVPHQANLRIIEMAAKSLGLPLERFVVNVDRYGNTSTASIPIAVCEAVEAGKIKPGNRIVLVGFGAGLTWGSAMIEWVIAGQGRQAAWWRSGFFLLRILARMRSWLLQAQRRVESFFWRG